MAQDANGELRHSNWEIFVLALSLVSLVNVVLYFLVPLHEDADTVILVVDASLCLVFLADFVYRLRTADSKREYLFRDGGWLDFVGSVPVPGFRLARANRVIRVVGPIRRQGGRRLWRDFVRERAQGALFVVLLLVVLVLEFASIGVLHAERGVEDASIVSASDALWWGYVTITTVGYGDEYPVTNEGRIVGVFLLTIGVGLFGTFTAFVANVFLTPRWRGRRLRARGAGVAAELRTLLAEHQQIAEEIRATLDELEGGGRADPSHPAPP